MASNANEALMCLGYAGTLPRYDSPAGQWPGAFWTSDRSAWKSVDWYLVVLQRSMQVLRALYALQLARGFHNESIADVELRVAYKRLM